MGEQVDNQNNHNEHQTAVHFLRHGAEGEKENKRIEANFEGVFHRRIIVRNNSSPTCTSPAGKDKEIWGDKNLPQPDRRWWEAKNNNKERRFGQVYHSRKNKYQGRKLRKETSGLLLLYYQSDQISWV